MSSVPADRNSLPDIAGRPHAAPQGTLDWVGVNDIHQPIQLRDGTDTRRVQAALNGDPAFSDFHVHIEHHDSLHAHNAVAVATKGIPGGYLPTP
jgi:GTP cyclohydrolase FolE2